MGLQDFGERIKDARREFSAWDERAAPDGDLDLPTREANITGVRGGGDACTNDVGRGRTDPPARSLYAMLVSTHNRTVGGQDFEANGDAADALALDARARGLRESSVVPAP